MMPPVIYTYWDQNPLPPLVEHCIRSWREHNPDMHIVVVDKQFALEQMSPPAWFRSIPAQNQSDWVRLTMLARHGGVWMDATTYALTPVTAWVSEPKALSIFYNSLFYKERLRLGTACKKFFQLENWALAAPAGHDFVMEWLRQYELSWEMGHLAYVKHLGAQGLYPECFVHRLPYFNQHLAATVVYANGLYSQPLNLLSMCTGMPCTAVGFLKRAWQGPPTNMYFFKMTGNFRKMLAMSCFAGLYVPGSFHAIVYNMPPNPGFARMRFLVICLLLAALLRQLFRAKVDFFPAKIRPLALQQP